jgi:hypothetical protein
MRLGRGQQRAEGGGIQSARAAGRTGHNGSITRRPWARRVEFSPRLPSTSSQSSARRSIIPTCAVRVGTNRYESGSRHAQSAPTERGGAHSPGSWKRLETLARRGGSSAFGRARRAGRGERRGRARVGDAPCTWSETSTSITRAPGGARRRRRRREEERGGAVGRRSTKRATPTLGSTAHFTARSVTTHHF